MVKVFHWPAVYCRYGEVLPPGVAQYMRPGEYPTLYKITPNSWWTVSRDERIIPMFTPMEYRYTGGRYDNELF